MSTEDFIAEEDIFIDAQGKVVEKKDAQTKLASKGARVPPADVEKYGLKKPALALKGKQPSDEAESVVLEAEGSAQSTGEKIRVKKGKE